ncbi:hypothetical protein DXG01_005606 [Tephrocybe rancida]|nr:hypothetical protein DXG01_005606 [Tephrocybe rancida]
MGSSQSLLSPETALTVAVVIGAVGIGYTQLGPSGPTSSTPSTAEPSSKKGKKKKRGTAASSPEPEPQLPAPPVPAVVAFPKVIPGGFEGTTTPEVEATPDASKSTKSKKKKKGKLVGSTTSVQQDSATSSQIQPPQPKSKGKSTPASGSTASLDKPAKKEKQTTPTSSPDTSTRPLKKWQSSMSLDTDGSWTRVESRKGKSGPSVDVTTTSASEADPATGTSSPVAERTDADAEEEGEEHLYTQEGTSTTEQRRPLAERMLPKPRKTGVADMLETPDHPTVARVMRVQPRPDEKPASGFSWGDYEDVRNDADGEEDDAGWGVVKSRRSTRPDRPTTSQSQSLTPTQSKAPETLTKRQRQNAQKRDAQKVSKAEAEQERLAVLAKHKKELERERIMEQSRGGGATKGKVSGGMKATVTDSGKLVWE